VHLMKLTFHSIVHRDRQEVCRCSRLLTARVLKFARAHWGSVCSIDFLPHAKHLSGVEKSAFADILGEAAWSHT